MNNINFIRIKLVIVACLFLAVESGFTQGRYSIGLGIGQQKVGVPLKNLLGFPSHTSFFIEATRKYGEADQNSWYQHLGLTTFDNNSAGSGYLLQTHVGKTIALTKTLVLMPEAGLSLIHRFHPIQVYAYADNQFIASKDYGKIRPAAALRTSIGYQSPDFTLFLSYQFHLELFYAHSFPFIPVNYLHVGMRYHLNASN